METRGDGLPALTVGKVLCVGRNYADHVREMGGTPGAEPLLFLKPPTALRVGDTEIVLPGFSRLVHHEVEMVVRLGRGGKDLDPSAAGALVDAVAVGLDLTARDVQEAARERGHPWLVSKGWDGSAPVSALVPVAGVDVLADLELTLRVNGVQRQAGRTSQMIRGVRELLAYSSQRFTLEPGDLVFTGTPAGVGPVRAGDELEARLGDLARLRLRVREGPQPV